MNIFRRNKKTEADEENKKAEETIDFVKPHSVLSHLRQSHPMKLSAVYRCVEVLSDSVAHLPLELFLKTSNGKVQYESHPTYWLLNKEPNRRMTRFTFIKLIVTQMLLNGNAYAYIKRDDNGEVEQLVYIPSDLITIQETSAIDIFSDIKYYIVGCNRLVEHTDVLHFINVTHDGIHGLSTIRHAANTLNLANYAEEAATGFYEKGCNVSGILSVPSLQPNAVQRENYRKAWEEQFGGNRATGGVAILGGGLTYQPVTVNPSDSQLLETRAFEVIDICRFFGVSPVKVFDLSHSSYATVEATQIAFLTDSIAPLLEKLELEFERKLYSASEKAKIDVKFDTSQLLRGDMQARSEFYAKMHNIGVMTSNEIRRELDLSNIEGGNDAFIQVNMQKIKDYENNKQIQE